jgi:CheY-like chemotaxis protein
LQFQKISQVLINSYQQAIINTISFYIFVFNYKYNTERLDILLVEDNILNQKVVSFNLKKYNYNVTAVTNGFDAIEEIRQKKYDLILMDLMLPGMNGYEITTAIRKYEQENGSEKQIPIIAITANTLDNDREKCFTAGMNEYLSKPFTSEQLLEKVRTFIS